MPDPTPRVIAPSAAELETLKASAAQCGHTFAKIGRALSDGFTRAAFRWQQAEARRWEQWHRKQRNDIRRQQLALDTTYFGRKRRARRARGRAAGAQQPYVGGFIWIIGRQPGLRSIRRNWATLLYDEVDSFPPMTDEEAQADV